MRTWKGGTNEIAALSFGGAWYCPPKQNQLARAIIREEMERRERDYTLAQACRGVTLKDRDLLDSVLQAITWEMDGYIEKVDDNKITCKGTGGEATQQTEVRLCQ